MKWVHEVIQEDATIDKRRYIYHINVTFVIRNIYMYIYLHFDLAHFIKGTKFSILQLSLLVNVL